jgi:ferredoxin-NADP reductase
MPSYQVKLVGREELAEGTLAFRFEKPAGFTFKPGQAVVLELLDPPAVDGQKRRTFSLVSAPYEDSLLIATRMRDSAYKGALRRLPIGAGVKLVGPIGQLTLADTARPAVFIAGGIGVTPFISILRQWARDGSRQPVVLVYSSRRPEDAAFLGELQKLQRQSSDFRLFAAMTDMARSLRKWEGETGMVNADLLSRAARGLVAPLYYVVGPPAMVAAIRETLRAADVADDSIVTEEFYGY